VTYQARLSVQSFPEADFWLGSIRNELRLIASLFPVVLTHACCFLHSTVLASIQRLKPLC